MFRTLVQVGAYEQEAAYSLYYNNIIDSNNRLVKNPDSWHTDFLRIGVLEPAIFFTIVWQTNFSCSSNDMK